MEGFSLTAEQRRGLQRQLWTAESSRHCCRMVSLLELDSGRPVADVAELFGVSRQTIYNWIESYDTQHQPCDLADRPRSGRPLRWTSEARIVLQESLKGPPDRWGFQAVSWTVPLLQSWLTERTGLQFSESSIRQVLHSLGYTWKRSRYVLEPDPQREKKKTNSPPNPAVSATNHVVV